MNPVICLLLLITANAAPVLAADIFKSRAAWALDGGLCFVDGRPWFGAAKTWRGVISALLASGLLAEILGLGWQLGTSFGALAMAGDLLSSFLKRRVGIAVSGRAWLLDQLPESALPVLLLQQPLGLTSLWQALGVIALFLILDITLSPLLYRLRLRKRPY